MYKTTQKEIKNLIRTGAAIELTDTKTIKHYELRQIAYSCGIYGINGALLQHEASGQLYAIPSRSSILLYYC